MRYLRTCLIDARLARHIYAAKSGHVLCNGKTLKEFKLQFAHLINEASKTTQFGFSNFGDNVHKIDMEPLLRTDRVRPRGYYN